MHVGHPNRRSQLFQFRHRHLRVWKPAVQSLFKMPHISSARRLGSQGWIGVRRPCHSQALVNGLRGTPLSGATGASSRRSKSFRRTLGTCLRKSYYKLSSVPMITPTHALHVFSDSAQIPARVVDSLGADHGQSSENIPGHLGIWPQVGSGLTSRRQLKCWTGSSQVSPWRRPLPDVRDVEVSLATDFAFGSAKGVWPWI